MTEIEDIKPAKIKFDFDKELKDIDKDKSHAYRKVLLASFIFLIIIGASLVALFYFGSERSSVLSCSSDKSCFIAAAQECRPAQYFEDDQGTLTGFSISSDCILTKTMTEMGKNEPDEIKALFRDKSMTCQYQEGNFNTDWVDTLTGSLYLCEGPLKEAIYEVMITQYELALTELQNGDTY